mmetsp:Transcript_44615/g.110984  ORF Transcript_44615/g.110984 Transcript_44615/m.110984 type:complete len:291 (-) Transcript_44615:44-916(-)
MVLRLLALHQQAGAAVLLLARHHTLGHLARSDLRRLAHRPDSQYVDPEGLLQGMSRVRVAHRAPVALVQGPADEGLGLGNKQPPRVLRQWGCYEPWREGGDEYVVDLEFFLDREAPKPEEGLAPAVLGRAGHARECAHGRHEHDESAAVVLHVGQHETAAQQGRRHVVLHVTVHRRRRPLVDHGIATHAARTAQQHTDLVDAVVLHEYLEVGLDGRRLAHEIQPHRLDAHGWKPARQKAPQLLQARLIDVSQNQVQPSCSQLLGEAPPDAASRTRDQRPVALERRQIGVA